MKGRGFIPAAELGWDLGALEAAEKRPNAVILSSGEGSRSDCFHGNARFFVACWLLRMTV
jgi:hypothetical protein